MSTSSLWTTQCLQRFHETIDVITSANMRQLLLATLCARIPHERFCRSKRGRLIYLQLLVCVCMWGLSIVDTFTEKNSLSIFCTHYRWHCHQPAYRGGCLYFCVTTQTLGCCEHFNSRYGYSACGTHLSSAFYRTNDTAEMCVLSSASCVCQQSTLNNYVAYEREPTPLSDT